MYEEEPGRDYRKERDAAYAERNKLVAALARITIWAGPEWDGHTTEEKYARLDRLRGFSPGQYGADPPLK